MVSHEDGEVLANGLDVEGGIGRVDVEPHLEHVEPVQSGRHILTGVTV